MALTPQPFFGHGSVALFSADKNCVEQLETPLGGAKSFKEYKRLQGEQEERSRISNLHYIFQDCFNNIWGDPFTSIDEKTKAVDGLTKEFRNKVTKGDEYSDEENLAQEEIMSDENKVIEQHVDETDTDNTKVQLSPEEYEALQSKAALADERKAELERLETERLARETEQKKAELREVVSGYAALPIKVDEFVVNMTALEAADAEAAEWVKSQFASLDAVLKDAGIFGETGTDEEGEEITGLTFLQIVDNTLKEDFNNDPSRYADALLAASAKYPELAKTNA